MITASSSFSTHRQPHQTGLSTLHHAQPNDTQPQADNGDGRMRLGRHLGVAINDHGHDDDGAKDQQASAVDIAKGHAGLLGDRASEHGRLLVL